MNVLHYVHLHYIISDILLSLHSSLVKIMFVKPSV